MNLNIFDGHQDISLCETMATTFEQCEAICSAVEECKAVHYCSECVDHNCRLLKEAKDGPSKLILVGQFDYVDYSEKGICAK
jgi:hypothetical protein